ncbi:unnamed protein product [Rotaria socialis]|uniref:Uncharacterized protein n=1 Tax=Rotaria socialis TaxID=392032 RepID=A0A820X0N4_9BILA|nr:unnamed protein product [Rotaria socialis]CAF4526959.1 unnamed protein product [Rotaria socialis]
MIDWITIAVALAIIAALVGFFGFVAWKINMPDPLGSTNLTGKKDDINQLFDSIGDKKKKDKSASEQAKKKRKEQKKLKRENKEEDHQRHVVKFKEPNEESDNEREESDQESSSPLPPTIQLSSKPRKRNKKKTSSPTHIEGILINKGEKSPVTSQAAHIAHPLLATTIPKDEVELAKQHGKGHMKSPQQSNKQVVQATPPAASAKKPTASSSSTNVNQDVQKQQQQQEQPFTTVVNNRHKTVTPPLQQQQQQQQQNKFVNTSSATTTTVAPITTTTTTTVSAPAVQQAAPVPAQHEQLPQRSTPRQQEAPARVNGLNTNLSTVKQPVAAPLTKLADIVKTLPTSQTVVTELMLALDAVTLSTDELDIIMHKIANKQAVIKKDWTKLQHGQKVDPQAHIGQILYESARAVEEDLKTNAMKRVQELTDERSNDKRLINELLKEKNEKEINMQVLHAQLNACQHPQQQIHKYEAEYQRLTEENMQLKQRLTHQQQHFQQQQQQYSSLNIMNNNGDATNIQLRVLSEQTKKLSVDNANLEKQTNAKDQLIKEVQKEKDDLLRSNQQLLQKVQEAQKQYQLNEEKVHKEFSEKQNLHLNQLNEFKCRIQQLELDKEKQRQDTLAQIEAMQPLQLNNEEREKFEQEINQLKQKFIEGNEQNKKNLDEKQSQYQSNDNELRQQIEQLKKTIEQCQTNETQNNALAAKTAQIDALQSELAEAKANNDAIKSQLDEHVRQEKDKQKQILIELLAQDARNQLPNDNQDFNEWLSSYRRIFEASAEATKQTLHDESAALKRENDQLHKNMREVESQLKEIEQAVQSKEEVLLADLKCKDTTLGSILGENEQLNSEIQRLRSEINRLQSAHDTTVDENRLLKVQFEEQKLLIANSLPTTAPSTSNVDETTVSSSFDQKQIES